MDINIIAGYNEMKICVGDYTFDIMCNDGYAVACGSFANGIKFFYTNEDGIKYTVDNIEPIILDVVAVLKGIASKYTPDIDVITYVSRVLDSFEYDSITMTVKF